MDRYAIAFLLTACVSCGSSTATSTTASTAEATATDSETAFPDAYDPAYAAQFNEPLDPRVSASAGEEGGVVVLWPRVVPAHGAEALHDQVNALQARMRKIAERIFVDASIDVRPEPQRACPHQGCAGVALGALFLHEGGGCAILALVSSPGKRPALIVPWSGDVEVQKRRVPFREPPEDQVKVRDMVRCTNILETLDEREADVEEAVRAAKDSD
jgi:hypothetical protein